MAMNTHSKVEELLRCPTTSYWLQDALRSALDRDPVDALHDAQTLVAHLREHLDRVMVRKER